jgi:hypothetical protein
VSIFIASNEKRLARKKRQPPGIGQSGRDIVRYVRNTRNQIGLPKGNRLPYGIRRPQKKSEKYSKIENSSEFHRIKLLLRAKNICAPAM